MRREDAMKKKTNLGNANTRRGDPINGPHNTAAGSTPAKTNGPKQNKGWKKPEEDDAETDGGYMLTTSEIQDFSAGTDSWT